MCMLGAMTDPSPSAGTLSRVIPDLVGSRVLIIGGGGSVGRTAARLVREVGATPIVADRGEAQFKLARQSAGEVETFEIDARDEDSVAEVFDAARADHVLLCTGWALFADLADFDPAEVMDWIGDRIEPMLALAKWTARHPGRLRSVTIVSGLQLRRPEPRLALWSLMGPAIIGLAEHLAVELAPTRVNVVGPAPMVDSRMFRHGVGSDAAAAKVIENQEARNPTRRTVKVEDTVRQVLLVMGDPVITGSFRAVDAGSMLVGTGIEFA